MNLQPTNPMPVFQPTCIQCGKQMQSDREVIYADSDGEPFKAYYCEPCATARLGGAL